MHPRISFNHLCFPGTTIETDIERWHALGAIRVGLRAVKLQQGGWESGLAAVRASGFKVATIVQAGVFLLDDRSAWQPHRDKMFRVLEGAHQLGAETVYTTTGSRGGLTWEAAAEAYTECMHPVLQRAQAAGIPLLIEPTLSLHAELSFVHSLRDTVQLAERSGLGVCIDMGASWSEAGLKETVERAISRCHLVQLSDYMYGDHSLPCRAVLGDGVVPLRRIIGWILEAGYQGAFDLELNGPRIDAEGHVAAVRRSAQWLLSVLPSAVG